MRTQTPVWHGNCTKSKKNKRQFFDYHPSTVTDRRDGEQDIKKKCRPKNLRNTVARTGRRAHSAKPIPLLQCLCKGKGVDPSVSRGFKKNNKIHLINKCAQTRGEHKRPTARTKHVNIFKCRQTQLTAPRTQPNKKRKAKKWCTFYVSCFYLFIFFLSCRCQFK